MLLPRSMQLLSAGLILSEILVEVALSKWKDKAGQNGFGSGQHKLVE